MSLSRSPSVADQTHGSLVVRLQAGEDDAWWEFEKLFGDLIIGYAYKSGCPASMVDEIYQATMVALARSLPKLDRSKGKLRDYLMGIARRTIAAEWTRHYRQFGGHDWGGPLVADLAELPDAEASAPDEETATWLSAVVTEALHRTFERIEDRTYKSFCMNLLEGRGAPEVMDALDMKRSDVDNHTNRCLDMLCQALQAVIADLGDAGLDDFDVSNRRSRANLKRALRIYLKFRSDLRLTGHASDLSQEAVASSRKLIAMIREHSPPDTDRPLLRIQRPGPATWFEITMGDLTIGRRDSNVLALAAKGLSGLHARIEADDGDWLICDCSSLNGTYVNGKRTDRCPLISGDVIRLGKAELIFFSPLEAAP